MRIAARVWPWRPFDRVAHASRMDEGPRPRAVDDFDVIRDRLEKIKAGGVIADYVEPKKVGGLVACECGRTNEPPETSPCTGACGLPPGGRAGQGSQTYYGC